MNLSFIGKDNNNIPISVTDSLRSYGLLLKKEEFTVPINCKRINSNILVRAM